MSPRTHAYVLEARDELHLRELAWMLVQNGFTPRLIVEDDAPYTGQLMAVGVPPCERSRIRKLLAHLPLAK